MFFLQYPTEHPKQKGQQSLAFSVVSEFYYPQIAWTGTGLLRIFSASSLSHSLTPQDVHHAVISFVAGIFIELAVYL